MTVALSKFNLFTQDLAIKKHDFSADSIMLGLTDTAPTAAMSLWGNITEVTASSGYAAGGFSIKGTMASAAGVAKYTASSYYLVVGSTFGPFRYAVAYNLSAASKQLIGWYDYASEITLATSETLLYLPDNTNGMWTDT